jgi:ATP-dependent Zn protease
MRVSALARAACHEAGHSVFAYLLGFDPGQISIEPKRNRGIRGRVAGLRSAQILNRAPTPGKLRAARASAENEVVVLLGGLYAEGKFAGAYNWIGAASDLKRADEILAMVYESGRRQHSRRKVLEARAHDMVDNPPNWRAIEALAAILLKRRRIPGPEAWDIIRRAVFAATPPSPSDPRIARSA